MEGYTAQNHKKNNPNDDEGKSSLLCPPKKETATKHIRLRSGSFLPKSASQLFLPYLNPYLFLRGVAVLKMFWASSLLVLVSVASLRPETIGLHFEVPPTTTWGDLRLFRRTLHWMWKPKKSLTSTTWLPQWYEGAQTENGNCNKISTFSLHSPPPLSLSLSQQIIFAEFKQSSIQDLRKKPHWYDSEGKHFFCSLFKVGHSQGQRSMP